MIHAAVEFSFCLLEMISVMLLVQKFFVLRRHGFIVVLTVLGFAVIEYSMEFWPVDPPLLIPVMLFNMIVMICFLFPSRTRTLIAIVLVFYIVEGILSAVSIQFLTLTAKVSAAELMQESWLRTLGGYFNKLAVLIPILFMKRKPELPQDEGFDWSFRCCAFLLLLCVYINYQICGIFSDDRIRILSLLISAVLFGCFVLMTWMCQRYYRVAESKKRLEIEHNCNTLKENWLAETLENQENFRKQRHDLKHLLGMLEYYLKEQRNLEALAYVRSTMKVVEAISKKEHTGDPIIDSLLNRTMDNEPEVQFHLETGHIQWPLEEWSTCLLISNLLSNAVEAARQSPQKEVEFYLKEDDSLIYLTLINSVMPGRRVNLHRSSKPDFNEHGYGIQSIRSIVNQARGELDLHQNGDRFEVRILLPKEENHA